MFIGQPFDVFAIEGTDRVLDDLQAGGVDEVLLGSLWVLADPDPESEARAFTYQPTRPIFRRSILEHYAQRPRRAVWAPPFPPQLDLYRGLRIQPVPFPPSAQEGAAVLAGAITSAKRRGMRVSVFGPDYPHHTNRVGLQKQVSLNPEFPPGDCFNDPDYAGYIIARI